MKERDLPLTALRTFAVAARAESQSAAARQLGVTHGAVSKQIGALEAWLGQKLFVRQGRTLALTPYGEILAGRLDESIRHIGDACDYVRRHRAQRVITVEAPATFAMYFLLPRLAEFEAQHAKCSVWISTRLTGQAPDFSGNDVVIVRGHLERGGAGLGEQIHLFQENPTLVSARALLRRLPVRRVTDVLKHKCIVSATRPEDWNSWLAKAGLEALPVEGGHRFDHLFVALHAVRDGLGSTIAPHLFFESVSDRHRLRCPLGDIVVPGQHYVAYATPRAQSVLVDRFVKWLQRECAAS